MLIFIFKKTIKTSYLSSLPAFIAVDRKDAG